MSWPLTVVPVVGTKNIFLELSLNSSYICPNWGRDM